MTRLPKKFLKALSCYLFHVHRFSGLNSVANRWWKGKLFRSVAWTCSFITKLSHLCISLKLLVVKCPTVPGDTLFCNETQVIFLPPHCDSVKSYVSEQLSITNINLNVFIQYNKWVCPIAVLPYHWIIKRYMPFPVSKTNCCACCVLPFPFVWTSKAPSLWCLSVP